MALTLNCRPIDHNSAQEKEDSRHTLPTSKKIIKAKLKLFHDELLLFAKNKQLSLANKKFRLMQKRGYPLDVHSYGNIINVCVRCQDIDKAERYEKEMRERNLPMNIIIFTTLLKGKLHTRSTRTASLRKTMTVRYFQHNSSLHRYLIILCY